MTKDIYDILGVGIGPFNLGLAALLEPISGVKALFLEQKPEFIWHSGLLIEGSTIQVSFLADLVTMVNPSSRYSYLNYLQEQSRLYHFYILERFQIPRREYNHYCQWVANQLESCQFGQRVEAIYWQKTSEGSYFEVQVRDVSSQEVQTYLARHLVLGVGSVPQVPNCFKEELPSEKIFHSAEFLHKRDRPRTSKSVTVLGSGQSAAEVFYELLVEQETYGYELHWHTRSSSFLPMEYTKLALEHFSPDYIRYFYHLSAEMRSQILQKQTFFYKGISHETITKIYDLLYERTIAGKKPPIQLLPLLEAKEVTPISTPNGTRYQIGYRHQQQGERINHETDCIILATGYNHAIPACISGLKDLIEWDDSGKYKVNLDYQLRLTKAVPNQIFLQNGELHTHGIGAPDLGLGAYRNAVIINTLTGKTIYPVNHSNVFQKFGVAAS